jgi:hypothetical protein
VLRLIKLAEGAIAAAASNASSYRVKFNRENFLELVRIARPKIIYRRKNMHFFAYDGFVMYSDQCENTDFSQTIFEAIEFSNYDWAK